MEKKLLLFLSEVMISYVHSMNIEILFHPEIMARKIFAQLASALITDIVYKTSYLDTFLSR